MAEPRQHGPERRLDAVVIRFTVGGSAARRAADALGLSRTGVPSRMWFCEDLSAAVRTGDLPLLDRGVILLVRQRVGHRNESTVRLRPCRRSQLSGRWLAFHRGDGEEFRLEADWSGERRDLSASLESDRGPGAVATGHVGALFSATQRQFVADCADPAVDFDRLSLLGPVHALRGRLDDWHGFAITTERWRLDAGPGPPLDLFELSVRVEPQGAEIVQLAVEALARRYGLVSGPGRPISRLVLERLLSDGI